MAIISVKEDWRGLGAEADTEGAVATRIFTVKFDGSNAPPQRPILAPIAAGIPALNSIHPHQPWLHVKNKTVESIGPFDFQVTVNYSARPTIGGRQGENLDPTANPLEAPWIVEWDFVTSNEPIDTDIDGLPIVNSAGASFDPPITDDFHDLLLRIQRNEAAFDPERANSYKNAINSDWFWDLAPSRVKCVQFTARTAISGTFWYWQVRYAFQIREEGWDRRVLDRGYRQYNETTEKYEHIQIEDETGNKINVTEPWPLDGQGHAISQSNVRAGVAEFLYFKLNKSLPFSVLGL